MRSVQSAVLLIMLSMSNSSLAEEATPSHIYQVTESIKAELVQIYKTLNKELPDPFYNFTERRSRHVLQKTREVLLKLNRMKQINNIEFQEFEQFTDTEATPENLKQLMEFTLQEIREVKVLYQTSGVPLPALFISGKSYADIYENLVDISVGIDELMGKGTLPQNVYRTAISVVNDIEKIQRNRNIIKPIEAITLDKSKTPTDVYERSYILLERIQKLSRQQHYAVPGSVLLPVKIEGRKVPEDVQELLSQIQAELAAMKLTLGITEVSIIPQGDTNKTPPDVYRQIEKAIMIVDSLL